MKRFLKISLCVTSAVLIVLLSLIPCFAKGGLTLDGAVSAQRKQTFTYTLYLADCEKPITTMSAYLFYDSNYLKLDKSSIDFHDIPAANKNTAIKGFLPFTFSAMSAPINFSKKKPVVSVDFKVLKAGDTSIKYFIGELDGGTAAKSKSIKEFTVTCDYLVHADDADYLTEDLTPVLLDDKEKLDKYQGDFINYSNGKGTQDDGAENHVAVTGETQGKVIDVTKDKPDDYNTRVIITVLIIVLILAIVIVVVLRKVYNPAKSHESDEKAQSKDE